MLFNTNVCTCVLRHVRFFVTPWTVARQAPHSVGFSRQEYWSGLPFPTPGDLPTQGLKLCLWHLLRWQANSLSLVRPFQILKDDAVKALHSVCQQIWKTQQWPQDWRSCFHSNPKERQCQRMFKLPHKCTHFTR